MQKSPRMAWTLKPVIAIVLMFVLSARAETVDTSKMVGCASDANWAMTSKKLDALAAAAQCGSNFSQSECRAGLGLAVGGAAAVLATGVAAKTSLRIKRQPKLCGLRGSASNDMPLIQKTFVSILLDQFLNSAYASGSSCVDAVAAEAREIRLAAEQATLTAEEHMRETGRAKLAAEYPEIAKNIDDRLELRTQILRTNDDTLKKTLMAQYRALEDQLNVLVGRIEVSMDEKGRPVRKAAARTRAVEEAERAAKDLFDSRPSHHYTAAERKAVSQTMLNRYSGSLGGDALNKLRMLETELATQTISSGRVKQIASSIAETVDSLAAKASSSQLIRLAQVRESLGKSVPALRADSRLARDGVKLLKDFKSMGGKVSFGLFGLVAAGASQASDRQASGQATAMRTADAIIPGGLGNIGCGQQMQSMWATIESDDCQQPRAEWNAKTADFALQPEYVQRKELSNYPAMCKAIDQVYLKLGMAGVRATCKEGGAIIQDDRQQLSMVIRYDKDGLVERATATGKNSNEFSEYDLRFSGDDFQEVRFPDATMASSGVRTNFDDPKLRTRTITREKLLSKKGLTSGLAMAESHFSRMQPVIQYTQACCAGTLESSDPRCAMLGRASGGQVPYSSKDTRR